MRRPKRRLAATLAICIADHRVRHLRISLGEQWRCWLLLCALGIPRYLPLFVYICTGFQCRSGLVWALLRGGMGYGQPPRVGFYASMGLDRSTMVSVLFAPLRTHRERVCVLVFRRWIVRSGRLNDMHNATTAGLSVWRGLEYCGVALS